MNLPQFSLKRPVTIVVAMLVFITIGIISLTRLPLEMFPDISFPGLMVWVPYPSSSPEEVERTITRPLEDILATINNLKALPPPVFSIDTIFNINFIYPAVAAVVASTPDELIGKKCYEELKSVE